MLSPSSPYRMIANVCCQQSWESFGTSVSARVKPRKQPVTWLLPYFLGLIAFGSDPEEKKVTLTDSV